MPPPAPDTGSTPPGVRLFLPGAPFSAAELAGMRRDGLLRYVYAGAYAEAHLLPGPAERAAAATWRLSDALKARAVLGRMSAAWVYGCADAPGRAVLLADRSRRSTWMPGAALHEVRLGPADVVTLGTARVTSPLRTALDLAYHEPSARTVPALALLGTDPDLACPLGHVLAVVLARRRAPGREHALRCLRLAMAAGA